MWDGNPIPLCCCIVSSFMIYHLFVTRVTRRIPLVGKEMLTLQKTWVHHRFLMGFVLLDLSCVVFCTALFFYLYFLFRSIWCLSSFDLRSDYTFGIFKFSLHIQNIFISCSFSFLQNIFVVTFSNKQWGSMLIVIQMDRWQERPVTTNKLLLVEFNV
jgi:hypothetical protein